MRKQLNLNPKVIEKNNKKDIGKLLIVVYLLLTILLFINAGVIYYDNKSLEKNSEVIKSEIKNYKEAGSDYDNISNDIKDKERFINKMKTIDRDVSAWEYVNALKKYFPKNVSLENISFTPNGINMTGIADKEDDVTVFLANLQMSKMYKSARLVSMNDISITLNNDMGIVNTSDDVKSKDKTSSDNKNTNNNSNDNNTIPNNKDDNNTKDKNSQVSNEKPKVINKVKFTISVEGVKSHEKK